VLESGKVAWKGTAEKAKDSAALIDVLLGLPTPSKCSYDMGFAPCSVGPLACLPKKNKFRHFSDFNGLNRP
jgi:hypothetical protein